MNKANEAVRKYKNGHNCAQAILTTFSEELGLHMEIAKNMMTGFGAGINYRGEMCGAVSAALLTIGLKLRNLNGFEELKKELVNEYSNEFIQQFTNCNKTVSCNELLNIDISNPKELEMAREIDLFKGICPGLVRSSALILDNLLTEIENYSKIKR